MTEFIVIMSGVLAALAADSALDNYRERQSTREVLEALRDDITADLRSLDLYFAPQLQQQQDSRRRLEAFLKSTNPVDDSFEFVNDVRWVLSYYTLDPNSAGFQDLISSGGLRLIRDPDLRKALLAYQAEIYNIGESDVLHRAYFLNLYGELGSKIVGGLALSYSLEALTGHISEDVARREAADAIDEDFIRSSDMLRRILVNTAQAQQIKRVGYKRARDKAELPLTMLNNALGES